MAFDAFIKIKDIPGESTDSIHKDWIELQSYNFSAAQPQSGSMSATGAHSAGRPDLEDFAFTCLLSKATPKMALALVNGTHIGEIVVEVCRATGDKQKFKEYKFTNCMLTSMSSSGADGVERPSDEIKFKYGKIEWTYIEFSNDGKKKGEIKANYDLTTNTGH